MDIRLSSIVIFISYAYVRIILISCKALRIIIVYEMCYVNKLAFRHGSGCSRDETACAEIFIANKIKNQKEILRILQKFKDMNRATKHKALSKDTYGIELRN